MPPLSLSLPLPLSLFLSLSLSLRPPPPHSISPSLSASRPFSFSSSVLLQFYRLLPSICLSKSYSHFLFSFLRFTRFVLSQRTSFSPHFLYLAVYSLALCLLPSLIQILPSLSFLAVSRLASGFVHPLLLSNIRYQSPVATRKPSIFKRCEHGLRATTKAPSAFLLFAVETLSAR